MNVRSVGALLVLAFTLALGVAPPAQAHSGNTIDGILTRFVGDPHPNLRAQTAQQRLYTLTADDGHQVLLDIESTPLPAGGLPAILNRRVRVTADAGVASQFLASSERLLVRSVQVLNATPAFGAFSAVTGNQKYISILCKYSDIPAFEPQNKAYFDTQLGASYPGFNHYFREMSYNLLTLDGSGADVAWVTLPKTRAQYGAISNPSADPNVYLVNLFADCTAAANATVDFTQYYGINMMFNDKVDSCCAWGGSIGATLDGSNRAWPVTWMPYWVGFGWLDHGVLAHEMSHAFGSSHSKDPNGFQYGSQWDVVSNPGGTCAVFDASYGCIGQHQVAYNKISMGIMPASRIANHAAAGASTAYDVERMAQPPTVGGTYQMVKAAIAGTATQYYTIESRQQFGYDQNVPGNGVILHKVTVGNVEPAHLLSPLGTGPNLGDIDSLWTVGSTFISIPDNIKITVNSFSVNGTANVTVEPATTPGAFNFALANYAILENAAAAINVSVTRQAPYTASASVTWTTANGTASAGTDYGTNGNPAQRTGTLNWAAGDSLAKNITVGLSASNVPVIGDTVAEASKAFSIALSNPVGGILGGTSSTTVTINDNDSVVGFNGITAQVGEAGPNMTVEVTRTGATQLSQAVTWRTANGVGAGGAMLGSDFGANGATVQPTGTLTFGVGETSKLITIGPINAAAPYVRINNDTTIEGPEIFTIVLSAPTNGAVIGGGVGTMTVTINSDERGVSMQAATVNYAEHFGGTSIMAARSGDTAGALNVNYAFNNGTGAYAALNGVHFTGVNGVVSWADGEGGTKPIPFTLWEDTAPNTARTFSVTLSGATAGTTLVAPMTTTVSIGDNDSSVQFVSPTATVAEGTANLSLSISRAGVTAGQTADITWTAANGTAIAGTDYGVNGNVTPPTGSVHWNAGETTSKTIMIPILNDALVEGAKNFTVTLSNPVGSNLSIGANPVVTVTLNDNDAGIAFQSAAYEVTEGTANIVLTVTRIGPATLAASANWATVNGTATSGQDFGVAGSAAPRTGTVSWLAGNATPKTITIPIINDALGGEGDETFTVTLAPGSGLVLGTPGVATVTIHDNDIPPESAAQFSAPKYLVVEGDEPSVVLTVNRVLFPPGNSFALPASVGFSMLAGSALATSDYTAATGTLNWAGGDSAPKLITIPIVNNATAEPPEQFKVLLNNNSPGMGINTSEATVTILDDDEVFPPDGEMLPAPWMIPSLDLGWAVSNDPGAYEGVYTLKSASIFDGETSSIQLGIGTCSFTSSGNVAFRVKISSEPNFDVLRFLVDGVVLGTWSGTTNTGWQMFSAPLTGGLVHTLRWEYVKDGSVSMGQDAAWIDSLTMPPNSCWFP